MTAPNTSPGFAGVPAVETGCYAFRRPANLGQIRIHRGQRIIDLFTEALQHHDRDDRDQCQNK